MTTVFAVLVALTCLPVFVLTSWTLDIKPGAGPQGGEVIAMGWLLVFMWLGAVTVFSAVRQAGAAAGAAAFVAAVLLFWFCFWLLNHSSLTGVSPARAKAEIWASAAITGAVIAGNVVAIRMAR
jgi:hypothetical protein